MKTSTSSLTTITLLAGALLTASAMAEPPMQDIGVYNDTTAKQA